MVSNVLIVVFSDNVIHTSENDAFIDLTAIKLDGSIREVDPPKHLFNPTVESWSKLVSNILVIYSIILIEEGIWC